LFLFGFLFTIKGSNTVLITEGTSGVRSLGIAGWRNRFNNITWISACNKTTVTVWNIYTWGFSPCFIVFRELKRMILHGGWGSILREGGGSASVNTNKSGSPWRKVRGERERVKEIGERESGLNPT